MWFDLSGNISIWTTLQAEYRIARVSRVIVDKDKKVTTLEVLMQLMRPRDKQVDGSVKYVPKDLVPMIVSVQRVALLMLDYCGKKSI